MAQNGQAMGGGRLRAADGHLGGIAVAGDSAHGFVSVGMEHRGGTRERFQERGALLQPVEIREHPADGPER